MTASVNHKCWISRLHTRNDKDKRQKTEGTRENETHGEGLQRTPAVRPVNQNKMSVGWRGFFTPRQTDLKQTEIKGQSLLKCTSCIHIQKKNNSASINYVQRKQTSTNVGMDTIGSKWQSHLLLLHAHSWTAQFILSCLSGVFCQDKWGDFIHISYSRWSLRLFQCQTLVVNPNEQNPWRTEWGQPPSTRSLSASVARCGSLCACLPHLRSHRLLNLTWENKNLTAW